ncbi:MAG: hypothetical protein V7749_17465 [Cocleimonas sp.]
MAIWHFKFSLLPKKGILKEHTNIPLILNEYKENFVDSEKHVDDDFIDYWHDCNIAELEIRIQKLLPSIESWSTLMRLYGYEKGTKVEVWDDDINFKIDTRKPDYTFLKEIVNLAKDTNCLLTPLETGELIEPVFEKIIEEYQNSRAYRFTLDSDQVLDKVHSLNK